MSPPPTLSPENAAQLYRTAVVLQDYLSLMEYIQQHDTEVTVERMKFYRTRVGSMSGSAHLWRDRWLPHYEEEHRQIEAALDEACRPFKGTENLSRKAADSVATCTALQHSLAALQTAKQAVNRMLDRLKWDHPELEAHLGTRGYEDCREYDMESTFQGLNYNLRNLHNNEKIKEEIPSCAQATACCFVNAMMRGSNSDHGRWRHALSVTLNAAATNAPRAAPFVRYVETLLPRVDKETPIYACVAERARADCEKRDLINLRRGIALARPDDSATVRYLRGAAAEAEVAV